MRLSTQALKGHKGPLKPGRGGGLDRADGMACDRDTHGGAEMALTPEKTTVLLGHGTKD